MTQVGGEHERDLSERCHPDSRRRRPATGDVRHHALRVHEVDDELDDQWRPPVVGGRTVRDAAAVGVIVVDVSLVL